ncbi:hypothetical protein [Paludibacterium paludis]|nr:hypothetical protein [Paludibacterium paludis]
MCLPVVSVAMSMLPGMKLESFWAWMPITNVSLAIREVLKGTLGAGSLAVVMLSTLLAAGMLIQVCVRLCRAERVLFRR